MEWILFTIGLLIGAIGGSLAVAIVSSGKMSDLDNEVISLRIQRNGHKIQRNETDSEIDTNRASLVLVYVV